MAVSIVSHRHGEMVRSLVDALLRFPEVGQVIVTRNVPERLSLVVDNRLAIIDNASVKGFGENHNAAFSRCTQPLFCVLNPDIEFRCNPFPDLIALLGRTDVGLAAPQVQAPGGGVEDSARHFPTLSSFVMKLLLGYEGRYSDGAGDLVFYPDWVGGMFMLIRSADFYRWGGFDEKFFLYYEDVDLCVRVWRQGLKVAVSTRCAVIHDARRESRHSLRYLWWHLSSVARYFYKHWGRLPRVH